MNRARTVDILARFQSLLALALLLALIGLCADRALTVSDGLNVLRQVSVNLCLSIGMTMIILSGGIDLSVGSVLALCGAVAASLLKNGITISHWNVTLQFTVFGAVVAGIGVGMAAGWVNGLVITRLRVPPFVATLGMLSIARGLTQVWTGNYPITNLGDTVDNIGKGYWLGLPIPAWIAATLTLISAFALKRTRFGRNLYAIGGNERAAMLSGLSVDRMKRTVYMLGGALAAVGGLLSAARVNAADPKVGIGYELDSIAAVVIGGTSISGGRGSIWGTVLGCLTIGVLNTGLVMLGISNDWQLVVKGVVIIATVTVDRMSAKKD